MELPDGPDGSQSEWLQRYEKMLVNKAALEMKLANNPSPDKERALKYQLACIEEAIGRLIRSKLDSPYFVR